MRSSSSFGLKTNTLKDFTALRFFYFSKMSIGLENL